MEEIVEKIVEKYEVDEKTATEAVEIYIESLRKSGLIEE